MTKPLLLLAAACWLLTCSLSGAAQDKGYWRASGSTAAAITGDIAITETKLTISFSPFTIAQIRRVDAAEILAVFDLENTNGGTGNLYRLNIPASRHFLHHNSLCGSDDAQWMVTYAVDRNLQVAFFSGSNLPVLTRDALANSTDLCGTFSYIH
ncbi:MAG TPA: hypothetical protein VL991_07260 [Terracidiphilus sp.]|nr:hypothetical protein [Terracidiphilus sp.]